MAYRNGYKITCNCLLVNSYYKISNKVCNTIRLQTARSKSSACYARKYLMPLNLKLKTASGQHYFSKIPIFHMFSCILSKEMLNPLNYIMKFSYTTSRALVPIKIQNDVAPDTKCAEAVNISESETKTVPQMMTNSYKIGHRIESPSQPTRILEKPNRNLNHIAFKLMHGQVKDKQMKQNGYSRQIPTMSSSPQQITRWSKPNSKYQFYPREISPDAIKALTEDLTIIDDTLRKTLNPCFIPDKAVAGEDGLLQDVLNKKSVINRENSLKKKPSPSSAISSNSNSSNGSNGNISQTQPSRNKGTSSSSVPIGPITPERRNSVQSFRTLQLPSGLSEKEKNGKSQFHSMSGSTRAQSHEIRRIPLVAYQHNLRRISPEKMHREICNTTQGKVKENLANICTVIGDRPCKPTFIRSERPIYPKLTVKYPKTKCMVPTFELRKVSGLSKTWCFKPKKMRTERRKLAQQGNTYANADALRKLLVT